MLLLWTDVRLHLSSQFLQPWNYTRDRWTPLSVGAKDLLSWRWTHQFSLMKHIFQLSQFLKWIPSSQTTLDKSLLWTIMWKTIRGWWWTRAEHTAMAQCMMQIHKPKHKSKQHIKAWMWWKWKNKNMLQERKKQLANQKIIQTKKHLHLISNISSNSRIAVKLFLRWVFILLIYKKIKKLRSFVPEASIALCDILMN